MLATSIGPGHPDGVLPRRFGCPGGGGARPAERGGGHYRGGADRRALAFLHAQGLTHGDLSPRNILFTAEGKPKLGDFGTHRMVGADHRVIYGTAGFLCPGNRLGPPDPGVLEPARDVYALAACTWYLLTGRPPNATASRVPLGVDGSGSQRRICEIAGAGPGPGPGATAERRPVRATDLRCRRTASGGAERRRSNRRTQAHAHHPAGSGTPAAFWAGAGAAGPHGRRQGTAAGNARPRSRPSRNRSRAGCAESSLATMALASAVRSAIGARSNRWGHGTPDPRPEAR